MDNRSKICLFLDFDGVLNSDPWLSSQYQMKKELGIILNTQIERGLFQVDPKLVENLERFVQQCDNLPIVISSNWRFSFSLEELTEILKSKGLRSSEVIGMTPTFIPGQKFSQIINRADEIQEWMKTHPEFQDFVAVDDLPLGDKKMDTEHLIRTNDYYGLVEEKVQQLVSLYQSKKAKLVQNT